MPFTFSPSLSLANFRIRYPEFESASDTLVQRYIDDALVQVDPDVFGESQELAAYCYVAKELSNSPFGQNARLTSDKGESTYSKKWSELLTIFCSGARVT